MNKLNRRELLKLGLGSGGAVLIASSGLRPTPAGAEVIGPFGGTQFGTCGATAGAIEAWPNSPLILQPFKDQLPVPEPEAWKNISGTLNWDSGYGTPGKSYQDCDGAIHQFWPSEITYNRQALPDPKIFQIKVMVGQHSFTSSQVQALVTASDGSVLAGDTKSLPLSTIYGFNGHFPGPMIYGVYGQPNLVRFENHLDDSTNPFNSLDRQDFGAPDGAFLTHLHNGHTAPESDGNPHWRATAYRPGQWCDNLYLNWPPDGDDREKQSFFWLHDHRMDHTGANVYKGMVGIYPIYDPQLDSGDEKKGYRLPGVPTRFAKDGIDYSKRVKYDLPLVLYDCRLDDGAVAHQDFHNGCGQSHPEWWGKTFFRHFPNHGFVGDIFTVNGTAFPVFHVKRRRYRLRFLDASISRIYELKLMRADKVDVRLGASGLPQLGQYNLFRKNSSGGYDPGGEQCMVFTQIASEGGLLPLPVVRDSFEMWPAKRREFIVDFSKYQDGTPTKMNDVMYLTNVLPMDTGRKPNDGTTFTDLLGETFVSPQRDQTYAVPMVKIVIDGDLPDPDNSVDPLDYTKLVNGKATLKTDSTGLPALKMRALPPVPRSFSGVTQRTFTLQRSGKFGGETQRLINGFPFDPTGLITPPLAYPVCGSAELWTIQNGGGGWVHPLHIHEEEHRVIARNGVPAPDPAHPDDRSKEDVVALGPSESVTVYRQFRTFHGPYVCHCHNLAHEDHAMMFGWTIV